LTIRYHNPNTDEETLKYIARIFIEASRVKFEDIMRDAAMQVSVINEAREIPVS